MVHREGRSRESGAIAVIAAIVLMVVGAFLALSLNIGHQVKARTELQAALDSGALAGARQLDGTTAALGTAHAKAWGFATDHAIDKLAVAVGSNGTNAAGGDIVVGYWNPTTRQFYSDGQSVTINGTNVSLSQAGTPQFYNAVKVVGGADGASSHNPALDVYFGGFLTGGPTKMATSSMAIAVGGGACGEPACALPFAIPSCALQEEAGGGCGSTIWFYFNHGHGKDIAFANIANPNQHPNTPDMAAQVAAAPTCGNQPVTVGEGVTVSNGDNFNQQIQSAFSSPTNQICTSQPPYTDCVHGVISVVDISDCSAPMTGAKTVIGFVRVVILGTQITPGNSRAIKMYVDCTGTSTAAGGCVSFGYNGKVRLVQ